MKINLEPSYHSVIDTMVKAHLGDEPASPEEKEIIRAEQEAKFASWFHDLADLIDKYIIKLIELDQQFAGRIRLSFTLLEQVLISYFEDISRSKLNHNIEESNFSKIVAFQA